MFRTIERLDLPGITNDHSFFGDVEVDVSSRPDEDIIAHSDPADHDCITCHPHSVADHRYTNMLTPIALSDDASWRETHVVPKDGSWVHHHASMVIETQAPTNFAQMRNLKAVFELIVLDNQLVNPKSDLMKEAMPVCIVVGGLPKKVSEPKSRNSQEREERNSPIRAPKVPIQIRADQGF